MLLKHFGNEMRAEVEVLVGFLPGSRIIHYEASKVL